MRRYLSISLLFLFIYSSIGHFLLLGGTLCVWKKAVKNQLIQATKESELVKIPLSANIRLLDEGKELELGGKRYDVVKKNASHYFCFQDEKETHLIKKMLGSLVQKASDDNDQSSDFSIFKNIFKTYFIENQYLIHFFYKKTPLLIFEHPTLSDCFFVRFFVPPARAANR